LRGDVVVWGVLPGPGDLEGHGGDEVVDYCDGDMGVSSLRLLPKVLSGFIPVGMISAFFNLLHVRLVYEVGIEAAAYVLFANFEDAFCVDIFIVEKDLLLCWKWNYSLNENENIAQNLGYAWSHPANLDWFWYQSNWSLFLRQCTWRLDGMNKKKIEASWNFHNAHAIEMSIAARSGSSPRTWELANVMTTTEQQGWNLYEQGSNWTSISTN
jgi:hypothetical protein